MSVMQVLNSNANHGLYVFRKNEKALREVIPEEAVDAFKSPKRFAKEWDIPGEAPMITKRGKFTQYGKEQLLNVLKELQLPMTATWQDVCDAIIKGLQQMRKAGQTATIQ